MYRALVQGDCMCLTIGGPKMSGNFVRERQRIIYVNNTLPLAHEISRHFWAAYGLTMRYMPQRQTLFVFLKTLVFLPTRGKRLVTNLILLTINKSFY